MRLEEKLKEKQERSRGGKGAFCKKSYVRLADIVRLCCVVRDRVRAYWERKKERYLGEVGMCIKRWIALNDGDKCTTLLF